MSLSKISTISPGLAPEYNTSSTYDVGDYVLRFNSYWRCIRAIVEPEPWTQEHWEMDYCFPKKLTQLTKLENGYRLGPSNGENASKVLASEAEAEELRSDKANKSEMSVTPGTGDNADKTTIQLKTGTSATVLTTHQDISDKADLVDGVVPASQLPSYVDDVVEYDAKSVADVTTVFRSDRPYPEGALVKHGSPAQAYVFTQAHPAGDWTGEDVRGAELFPVPGEKSKIYIALNTDTQYRWSGSAYIEIAKYVAPYDGTPEMAGTASPGTADAYSRGDHVHPTDTSRASVADATLTERGPNHDGFSAWEITWVNPAYPNPIDGVTWYDGAWWLTVHGQVEVSTGISDRNVVSIDVPAAKATRTALQGYQLGSQTNKLLASEAEAEALRTEVAGKADLVNGTVPTNELPDGTASGKGIVQLDAALATSGKAADAKATGDALADKRDKTDLKVYEQADYWEGIPTSGSTVTLTLESSASNSKTYSNGSEVGCYKMLVRDYRSAGGYFQVYLSKLSVIMGRETWTKVIVTPEESSSEITEVSTTISSPSYTFRHHAETVPEQDNFLATTKGMNSLLDDKADKSDVDPLLFAQYYPEGNVKSAAEFTSGIKYDDPDTTNRTITVKPFSNTGTAEDDNSSLVGRVVIPPFVDGDGNGYISDDGTRFKVVGVSNDDPAYSNTNLTAIVAPSTVTSVGGLAFASCTSLTSLSLPAAISIGGGAFNLCTSLTSLSLPVATSIGGGAFSHCTSLTSIDFGDTPRSSVPTLGGSAFSDVPTTCKIIVPDEQYNAWTTASGWSALYAAGYKFLKHSEWECARRYEVQKISESLLDIPLGNYADMDSIADRLDSVVRALKGIYGPDDRTLYFRSLQDGSTVAMQKVGNALAVSLEYSVDDGVNWSPFVVGETTVTINRGKWVRIRATSGATQTQFAAGPVYNKFSLGGSVAVGGNSMSLFYHEYADIAAATTFPDMSNGYILSNLFRENAALKDASALILPATTLADYCYSRMFSGCTSLTAAPELPATTLADGCYQSMFLGCSSLATAPELPATTLIDRCYNSMFSGCTSLTTAPELPATTLATACYNSMFSGCTSLTTAPELPATTLADYCYYAMFSGCTSLTTAPELPATTLVPGCYRLMFQGCSSLNNVSADFGEWTSYKTTDWLDGVSATGEFHCKPDLDISTTGVGTIPSGWTVVRDR